MSSRVFLQTLLQKLKGGNLRSIHLNALPGRFASRLDIKALDQVQADQARSFLHTILTQYAFSFRIHYDDVDLNLTSSDEQKHLLVLTKRLNAIVNDNEDYFKEHGVKTLGFGYPLLIKRSTKDPNKVVKAPLFIWPLDGIKSKKKVNEWLFVRNKMRAESDRLIDADLHPVARNEVLASFIQSEDGIDLPSLPAEMLEDGIIDETELLKACASVLHVLNSGKEQDIFESLKIRQASGVQVLSDASYFDQLANSKAYIHFGGVLGLFRAQKESIITDIGRLLDRYDDFAFDNLKFECRSNTPFSAVDTDPSQQAIIGGLNAVENQVIQGPPGTGKSQSLTALITNALANDLKCLVVCEKKTALDVIKKNLQKKGEFIASLVAVIDDINEDREAIVDSVRERQDKLYSSVSPGQARMQYETNSRAVQKTMEAINAQHRAFAKALHRGQTWTQIVGRFLKLKKIFGTVPLRTKLRVSDFGFSEGSLELPDTIEVLKRAQSLYHQGGKYMAVFGRLHESLFIDHTSGEARVIIEQYLQTIKQHIPELASYARDAEKDSGLWLTRVLSAFPKSIRQEAKPFTKLLEGSIEVGGEFQYLMPLQQFIYGSLIKIDELKSRISSFIQEYKKELEIHYGSYGNSISRCLSEYLESVNENEKRFGHSLYRNDLFSLIKTRFLSSVSKRHRELKGIRMEIRDQIKEIRQKHSAQSYIEHAYNDDQDMPNLRFYVDNVKSLQNKVQDWKKSTAQVIGQYLNEIDGFKIHPSCQEFNSRYSSISNEFLEILRSVRGRLELQTNPAVKNLKSIESQIVDLRDILDQYSKHLEVMQRQCTKRFLENKKLVEDFDNLILKADGIHIIPDLFNRFSTLGEFGQSCEMALNSVELIENALHEFRGFHGWQRFRLEQSKDRRQLIDYLSESQDCQWGEAFECWYFYTLLTHFEPPNLPKDDYDLQQFKDQKKSFNVSQIDSILIAWRLRQQQSVSGLRNSGLTINGLFNKKGGKGGRRNSLRKIVAQEFELFTDFFPVLLVNPSVCSSILPLKEGLFDVVIFDEASQLRLEETYAALIRGERKIVSGDKHQMPPSAYFQAAGAVVDPQLEEEDLGEDGNEFLERDSRNASHRNLADSESLLAYAEDVNYKQQYLDIHYRSQHPYLIDFSNHAFYRMRLIPVPPLDQYIPISFLQVNGTYTNSTNPAEVSKVIEILETKILPRSDGSLPSVGVATFNLYQRNLIIDEIAKRRLENSEFDAIISKLGNSFFVKNLENIQGDERDIIIISTTFGKKENGSFTQQFGPVIQSKGHRMLNVIITRAKCKIFICSSLPEEHISQYRELLRKSGNRGRAVLYAYLAYAKAVSDQNEDNRRAVLDALKDNCENEFHNEPGVGIGSESPFEEEVFSILARHIGEDRLVQQHSVGGFRIDIAIKSKITKRPYIAIECDGAKYHSSPEAYAWDIFRQEQLEKYGFTFHRIWSANWWDSEDTEIFKLLKFIEEMDSRVSFR